MPTKLRRTGNTPFLLDDNATLVFDEDNGTSSGPGTKRWHWLRIFRLETAHIAAVEFRENNNDHCIVIETESVEAVFQRLRQYDAAKYMVGLPARNDAELTRDGGRNKHIQDDLKERWVHLVDRAAKELGVAQPKKEENNTIVLRLSPELLSQLDARRASLSRVEYIQHLIDREVQK